jgi:tetratricopeptide (TPR) repeat protein
MAITGGDLIPAPATPRVPRAVTEALARGLSRDPAQRWPSLAELLDVLAPPARPPRWPIFAGVGMAVGALATGGILLAVSGEQRGTCTDDSRERVTKVWGAADATVLAQRFAATGRSYASNATRELQAGLDRYADHWVQLAGDVCMAEREAGVQVSEVLASRRACLDARLDGLRGLVQLVTAAPRPENVDHARDLEQVLPDLDDCVLVDQDVALPHPPPALAEPVAALERELETVNARLVAGEWAGLGDALDRLAARADALGYPPLMIAVHELKARRLVSGTEPAGDEAERALALAIENHRDRDAVRAYEDLLLTVGHERKPELVAAIGPLARATAARLKDRDLQLVIEIAYGRALARVHQLPEAIAVCRKAVETSDALGARVKRDRARDCLLEALAPAGRYSELEPLVEKMIADYTQVLGADHPTISDYLETRARAFMRHGKLVEARRDLARCFEIRRRAYPEHHYKIAELLLDQGELDTAEAHFKEARASLEQGLAILADAQPSPVTLKGQLHQSLAFSFLSTGDHANAVVHFEEAIKYTRQEQGDSSLELAFLLFNYGQVKAGTDYAAGRAMILEAHNILETKHDKRAGLASGALAVIEAEHQSWDDAREHAEEVLAHRDADFEPTHVAVMEWVLARALAATHGDMKRARELAKDARSIYAKVTAGHEPFLAEIDAWLKKH